MALVRRISTSTGMVKKKSDVVIVDLKGDGYEVKQEIHKNYTNNTSEVNEGILCIAHKVHFEKAAIERKFKKLKLELEQDRSRELEVEIQTLSNIHFGWMRMLPRLNELLVLLENGKFSVRCTLESCPDHSENNGICHCGEDLTEALQHFPELVGCAKGRTLLGIAGRRYGEFAPLNVEVTVIKPHPKKR